jgi:hypothetical protein
MPFTSSCGRNPVNRVFISGYGDYLHGSDFYSQFWTHPVQQPPGYLGGNINVEGSSQPVVTDPWKRFINTQVADMTEPGVYWNSALAWLAGYVRNDALPLLMQISRRLRQGWAFRRLYRFLTALTRVGRGKSRCSRLGQPLHNPSKERFVTGRARAGSARSPESWLHVLSLT